MPTAPDPADQVAALFPTDGPHTPDRTTAAARALTHLVRYLNHATRTPAALPTPGDVYDIIGSVHATTRGLDQTLRQTSDRLTQLADAPDIRHAAGGYERQPELATPAETALMAAAYLATAGAALAGADRPLGDAHVYAGRLYLDTPEGDQ